MGAITFIVIVGIVLIIVGITALAFEADYVGAAALALGALLLVIVGIATTPAESAELKVKRITTLPPATVTQLPREITHGHGWGSIGRFGTYSDAWLARRWRAMCAGGARYQAMGEAYDLGKRQPCGLQ